MKTVEVKTYWANIWIAGDYAHALGACRAYCMDVGLCVTVTATTYVFTGGSEEGVCVRLINYPRFPTEPEKLKATALHLADHLRCALCQHSYTVELPDVTIWDTIRKPD